jgi:AraC-like protein
VLLLDTALLPRGERRGALTEVLHAATRATRLGLGEGPDGPRARLDAWAFGPAAFLRAEGLGLAMARSAAAAAHDDEPYVSVAVHLAGAGRSEHLGRRRLLRPGDLAAIDLRAPYAFAWEGEAANLALNVPVAELALPADVVQRGSASLERSAVYPTVRVHLQRLAAGVDAVTADAQAPAVAGATLRLVRLLLAGAAGDARARDAHDAALPDLLDAHVRRTGDHDAVRAARALGTGPRYLARRCPGAVR